MFGALVVDEQKGLVSSILSRTVYSGALVGSYPDTCHTELMNGYFVS